MKLGNIGFSSVRAGDVRVRYELRVNNEYPGDSSSIGQIRRAFSVKKDPRTNQVSIKLLEQHGTKGSTIEHTLNPNEIIPYYDLVGPKTTILFRKAVSLAEKTAGWLFKAR